MKNCLNFQIQGKHQTCNVWLYPENNLHLKNLNLQPLDIIICDGPYGILEPECEWDDFDLDRETNFRRSHEAILYYTKEAKGFIFHGGDFPDVFSHPIIKAESNPFKDGTKPVNVIRYLLSTTHRPGGRLLNLFAGSGTDIVAALEYDMDVVGSEFNQMHRDIIVRRIKECTQNDL